MRFGSGSAYYRRYTKFFGREGTHVQELLARSMAQVMFDSVSDTVFVSIEVCVRVCAVRAHVRLFLLVRVCACASEDVCISVSVRLEITMETATDVFLSIVCGTQRSSDGSDRCWMTRICLCGIRPRSLMSCIAPTVFFSVCVRVRIFMCV